MRITKSVWVLEPDGEPKYGGESCEDPAYLEWVRALKQDGHEIALHNVSSSTATRERTRLGFERFRELFGEDPRSLANHTGNDEAIYHGEARVTGVRRGIYNVLTRGRRHNVFKGHVLGSPLFWGDICHEHVTYVRNFVYRDINTLKSCPYMPYHDASKPYVRQWFAGAEGASLGAFVSNMAEGNQQRLEDEQRALHHVHPPGRRVLPLGPRRPRLRARDAADGRAGRVVRAGRDDPRPPPRHAGRVGARRP